MRYKVTVEGVRIQGHPIQTLTQSFEMACKVMDEWHKRYPHHAVRMWETQIVLLKEFEGELQPWPEKCPSGHSGLTDGKPLITHGKAGFYCKVCGTQWKEKELP